MRSAALPLLFFSLISSPVFAQTAKGGPGNSTYIKGKNTCYAVKLPGRMIDANACDKVTLQIGHYDCVTRKMQQTERVQAKLFECRDDVAKAQVILGEDNFYLKINKQPGTQFDVWDIQLPGATGATVTKTAAIKSTEPPPVTATPATVTAPPAPPALPIVVNLDIGANGAVTQKLAGPVSADSQIAARQSRENSRQRSHIGVESANVRLSTAKNDWLFLADLSAGETNRIWLTPLLSDPGDLSLVSLSQAFAEKKINDRTYVKVGIVDSPMINADKIRMLNETVSYSYSEMYGVPHQLTGIVADRDLSKVMRGQFFFGSGWNKSTALEESWSAGARIRIKTYSKTEFRFAAMTSDEPGLSQHLKTTVLQGDAILDSGAATRWFARAQKGNASIERAPLRKNLEWMGVELSRTVRLDDKRSWGLRAEWFQNTDGLIIGRPDWKDIISLNAFTTRMIEDNVKIGFEAQADLAGSRSAFRLGALLSWEI